MHVRTSADAGICLQFLKDRYCDKGRGCFERHVVACPEFETSGVCKNGDKCKYPHVGARKRKRVYGAERSCDSMTTGFKRRKSSGIDDDGKISMLRPSFESSSEEEEATDEEEGESGDCKDDSDIEGTNSYQGNDETSETDEDGSENSEDDSVIDLGSDSDDYGDDNGAGKSADIYLNMDLTHIEEEETDEIY